MESVIDRHGKEVPLVQNNILPHTFETLNTQPAYMWSAILLMVMGLGMVVVLEKIGQKNANN
jgi:putative membrane protein